MNCSNHLVVISHGILGNKYDLAYLINLLKKKGCVVLDSSSNQYFKTLSGIERGGVNLASEIIDIKKDNPNLEKISFVGNSLGGLYCRYAVSVLYDSQRNKMAGLEPHKFMTIATPHLGVRNHTILEEKGISIPSQIKHVISLSMGLTGVDLFGFDAEEFRNSLIYKMSTHSKFLNPLKSFRSRRLYANLDLDYVVPLGTAALLSKGQVFNLRNSFSSKSGIVDIIEPFRSIQRTYNKVPDDESALTEMSSTLDSCGWEKVIVNFPGSISNSHNKLCAMQKFHPLVDDLLGYNEGRFVMENAAEWIINEL